MTVVHIFKDFYPPTVGGIEQHMHVLCRRLATTVRTVVLVPSRSRKTIEEDVDGIRVIRVPEFGRYASAPLCPTLPIWLRRLSPDIVHLHYPNPMGDLGFLMSGLRVPLVISYHADIIRQKRLLPLYQPIIDHLFTRANRIIVGSPDYMASSPFLLRHAQRTVVVPYGIESEHTVLQAGDDAAVREIRRTAGQRIVLFVGVLRYYKGVDVLIRALRDVEAHLIVVGHGADEARLRALAVELGVGNRITFAGQVSEERLRALFHAADVFALPSIDRCESFGIAQLEAMSCGTPVVSSDLPTGMRMVNVEGETGFRVPPKDPAALASAITRLLDDQGLRSRLGEAARARVRRDFSADVMAQRTRDVYASLGATA